MSTNIMSDSVEAALEGMLLKSGTTVLRDISAVGAGSTNHGVNEKGLHNYNNIISILDSYCNAGERDAERIKKIADELDGLDDNMKNNAFINHYI